MGEKTEKVLLGSGHLFIAEITEAGVVPDGLFDEANNVGCISGGAELSYTPTLYDVECDDGEIHNTYITKEEVILKSGILNWDLANLEKLSVGGTYNSATKTLKIGGKKSVKQYAVGFKHEEDDYSVEITMLGRANKGFTVSFSKEKETITDAEFKANKDSSGTLVTIVEKDAG